VRSAADSANGAAERNLLINCLHPASGRIRIGPVERFALDRRLLR
jgi:hypothetical protein